MRTPGQTNATILFTADRGAGSADIPFAFITPQAGLYPIRLVWYQGGGDGNLEFFTCGDKGEKIPVNGNHPKAVKAYHRVAGGGGGPTLAIKAVAGGKVEITYSGTLQSTDSLTPANWTKVTDATGSPYSTSTTGQQWFYRSVTP